MSRPERTPEPFLRALPGRLAAVLLVVLASLWTLWSVSAMFYQAWSLPPAALVRTLAPALAVVLVGFLALGWPRVGGWMLTALGGTLTLAWWLLGLTSGALDLALVLGTLPVTGVFVLVGLLLLAEARHRRLRDAEGWEPPPAWWRRVPGRVAVVAVPALVAAAITLVYVPMITGRVDDGGRGARTIVGNGVTLEWAPAGPGWNARLPSGAYPSWDALARYGAAPVGLAKDPPPSGHADEAELAATGVCSFLDDAGTALEPDRQGIWRLPTTRELVGSLVSGGDNAGCVWQPGDGAATCDRVPNKDTPLWAPDQPAIAYRTADAADADQAWIVPYSGGGVWGGAIQVQPKGWADAQVGFRCVRDVAP